MILQKLKKCWNGSILCFILKKCSQSAAQSALFGERNVSSFPLEGQYDAPPETNGWVGAVCRSILLQKLIGWAQKIKGVTVGQAAFVCIGWLVGTALFFLRQSSWVPGISFAVLSFVFLLFCGVEIPLWQWVCGSFLMRRVKYTAPKDKMPTLFFVVVSALCAVLDFLFGPIVALIVPGFFAAIFCIVLFPSIWWVYITLALVPLVGTTVCIVLTVVLLISYILSCAVGRMKASPWDAADSLLAGFGAICVICTVLSVTFKGSLVVVYMWLVLMLFSFLMKRTLTDFSKLFGTMKSFTVGAVLASVVGFYQYFSGAVDTTWTDTTLFEDLSIRVYSTFANPNVYGEFLLLAAPIAAGLMLYAQRWRERIIYGGALVAILANLALTYSRGCYAGIAVTAVVFLWFVSKKALGIAAILGIPAAIYMMPQNMLARIASMVNFSDSSTSYRLRIYLGTAGLLAFFWASGVGIGEGAFNFVYPFFSIQHIVAPHSHSLFLQWVVSFGVGGLVFFAVVFWWYARQMKMARRSLVDCDARRFIVYAFSSVFAGFLLQSVFDYTWYNYRVFMLFWVVLILGSSLTKLIREETR